MANLLTFQPMLSYSVNIKSGIYVDIRNNIKVKFIQYLRIIRPH